MKIYHVGKMYQAGVLVKNDPDNLIKIQTEDWSEDFPGLYAKKATVAVYPIAKRSFYRGPYAYPEAHCCFRLAFDFPNEAAAEAAYLSLVRGEKTLADYKEFAERKEYIDCV